MSSSCQGGTADRLQSGRVEQHGDLPSPIWEFTTASPSLTRLSFRHTGTNPAHKAEGFLRQVFSIHRRDVAGMAVTGCDIISLRVAA